jgi:uncharacterized protein (TIGR02271 family)
VKNCRNDDPACVLKNTLCVTVTVVNELPDFLPVIEETARVEKHAVVTGRVTVRTETVSTEELAQASLSRDEVDVTRVPVEREITAIPAVRTEGDVTIVPVVEERLVVEKRLVLVEEIRITRRTQIEDVSVPISLRKQTVVVERSGGPLQTETKDDLS